MSETERHLETNRSLWDAWTEIHRDSSFYDLEAFRGGASTLKQIELDLVGDVRGLDLLHLQCHFGLDSLSWARLGARVVGVDFSPRAIDLARELAHEAELDAAFHCGDVTSLPGTWNERFDLVFSSYGVLPWLPDLGPWASEIERVLRPGGSFHLVEFHPLTNVLDDDGSLEHPYFHSPVPGEYHVTGSYADRSAPIEHVAYEWSHSLADVHGALTRAGLTVRALREFPYSPYGCFDYLEETEPGRWKVRGVRAELPLVFALEATKPKGPGDEAGPAPPSR